MSWKASSVMEERLRFVARLLDGEAMTDVCREFGVSRKTGYRILDRYKAHGLQALSDRRGDRLHHAEATHTRTGVTDIMSTIRTFAIRIDDSAFGLPR
jgi:transposase